MACCGEAKERLSKLTLITSVIELSDSGRDLFRLKVENMQNLLHGTAVGLELENLSSTQ